MTTRSRWTEADDAALRENAHHGTRAVMAATGRTCHAVTGRAAALGVSITRYIQRDPARAADYAFPSRVWTTVDDEKLRSMAGRTAAECAKELDRTGVAVGKRARHLGVNLARKRGGSPAKRSVQRVRATTKPIRLVESGKPLRQVEYRGTSIEYCPQCGAPVSDWAGHFERLGHRRLYA